MTSAGPGWPPAASPSAVWGPRRPAITRCHAEGININVTLIFSRRRYGEVMDAFLTGVEHARAAGRDLTWLASVASLFVSRVDTEIDHRLDALGTVEAKKIRGLAAVANARLAFQAYDEIFTSARWRALARAGPPPAPALGLRRGEGPGIDQDDVMNTLERAGLTTFQTSWAAQLANCWDRCRAWVSPTRQAAGR
jgi:transaldolase